ncbi:hypothetical protein RUM43_010877 [Polyplax serrata]|uniref:Mediator of RNA polymerase II transcription subunit 9 n=1 Tax=Polyplax serrata TaxID=468196 RepID=A0AAN8NXL2_POLSC
MENLPNGQNNANSNGIQEDDVDLEFLPLIYEIIKSIERDPTHESTQKARDLQDTSTKILELEKKLNQAREQINQLPGIEHSQEEQLKQLVQKLADSYPMRRAAQLLVYFYNRNKETALEFKNLHQLQGLNLKEKLKKIYDELENQKKKL